MDIIALNEAATANSRIESFIENPDSTSGVVTVPTTIAAGETITIPAGRMAILPDLQIDGDLVVDGKVFIPNGTSLSKVVEKVTSTDNAIVRFDGITGEVQNSGVIVDDNGNVGIGVTPSASSIPTLQSQYSMLAGNDESNISTNAYYSGVGFKYTANGYATTYIQQKAGGAHTWRTAPSGTAGNAITWTNAMTLGSNGNLLLTSGTGGLGYGTGSGGTVTQLTSKSTSVTLNKPTGQIIMNNEALASGTIVYFNLYNSLIGANDTITINMDRTTGDLGKYKLEYNTTSGIVLIKLTNQAGASFSDALVLKFTVIKGANS